MKKNVFLLLAMLLIAVAAAGCTDDAAAGNQDTQTTENSNVDEDTADDTEDAAQKDEADENKEDDSKADSTDQKKEVTDELRASLEEYMTSVKEQADILKASLENDDLKQDELNQKSQELYELWDGALNKLWSELKNVLSADEFGSLLEQQRDWIAEKEDAAKEAGKEVEGGSMYALVVNMAAADKTEERVYELYQMLVK